MNYLLDTCVLSEFTRRNPEPKVVRWIAEADEGRLLVSAISIGEIARGIRRMPESHRKEELSTWFNERLLNRFQLRILPLDSEIMVLWGTLTARNESVGKPMPVFDSLLAATALYHNLILVTRNETDFDACGLMIVNPWK